ncbi:MAG: hypothetical protein AAGH15_01285 [Myxococcota bacterium]
MLQEYWLELAFRHPQTRCLLRAAMGASAYGDYARWDARGGLVGGPVPWDRFWSPDGSVVRTHQHHVPGTSEEELSDHSVLWLHPDGRLVLGRRMEGELLLLTNEAALQAAPPEPIRAWLEVNLHPRYRGALASVPRWLPVRGRGAAARCWGARMQREAQHYTDARNDAGCSPGSSRFDSFLAGAIVRTGEGQRACLYRDQGDERPTRTCLADGTFVRRRALDDFPTHALGVRERACVLHRAVNGDVHVGFVDARTLRPMFAPDTFVGLPPRRWFRHARSEEMHLDRANEHRLPLLRWLRLEGPRGLRARLQSDLYRGDSIVIRTWLSPRGPRTLAGREEFVALTLRRAHNAILVNVQGDGRSEHRVFYPPARWRMRTPERLPTARARFHQAPLRDAPIEETLLRAAGIGHPQVRCVARALLGRSAADAALGVRAPFYYGTVAATWSERWPADRSVQATRFLSPPGQGAPGKAVFSPELPATPLPDHAFVWVHASGAVAIARRLGPALHVATNRAALRSEPPEAIGRWLAAQAHDLRRFGNPPDVAWLVRPSPPELGACGREAMADALRDYVAVREDRLCTVESLEWRSPHRHAGVVAAPGGVGLYARRGGSEAGQRLADGAPVEYFFGPQITLEDPKRLCVVGTADDGESMAGFADANAIRERCVERPRRPHR